MSAKASSSVGCENRKPLASAALGMTFWPSSSSSSAKAPKTSRRGAAGAGRTAGRCKTRPSALSEGEVAHGLRRRAVDRAIQGQGWRWRGRSGGPGRPGGSSSSSDARRRTDRPGRTRTGSASGTGRRPRSPGPGRSAAARRARPGPGRASAAVSHWAQTVREKQSRPSAVSSSALVAPQAVPADGRAAHQHLGSLTQPGDQGHDGAGRLDAGVDDPPALDRRPQSLGDRFAGQVDDRVDAGLVRQLLQAR
jgi:hypothetical protein